MEVEVNATDATMTPGADMTREDGMVRQVVWEEIRRRHRQEGVPIKQLARDFDVDRNTIRRCLRQSSWHRYARTVRAATVLAPHEEFMRSRAPDVEYSARILYQELVRDRGFQGSYDTVKNFVRPLRALRDAAQLTMTRFETPPGLQSQIDWGQARVHFQTRPVVQHLFVLTLGFSRRGFYQACPDERLPRLLEAHECAFEHFGGHTREHLYDRPRTICAPGEGGKVRWNPTFKAFADYWGFEPRLCAAYRARTKGKVESGVKYVKRNFLPGRRFVDQADFDEQLREWNATIADVRIHGTTHERPAERFAQERPHLLQTAGQPSFLHETAVDRIVADDFLVSYRTNRYSVPFQLIGRTVTVRPREELLEISHGGTLVAFHPLLEGKHQVRILPEHGPGPAARNARQTRSTPLPAAHDVLAHPQVEVRDLAVYESLFGAEMEVAS
jgi:transposase